MREPSKETSEKCKVSGLPVTVSANVSNLKVHDNYYVTFKKIGDNILLAEAKGDMREYDHEVYSQFRDAAIHEYNLDNKKFIDLKDYKYLTHYPSAAARKAHRCFLLEQNDTLLGYILFNVNSLVKAIAHIGQILENNRIKYPVYTTNTYEDAIRYAIQIQEQKQATLSERENTDPDEEIVIKRKDLDDIKYRLSTIVWGDKESFTPPANDHILKPIHDIINILEVDYFNNITDLTESNSKLSSSQEKLAINNGVLQTMMDNLSVGIILTNLKTKEIVIANNVIAKVLQLQKQEIIGKTCSNLFCGEDAGICHCENLDNTTDETIEWKLGNMPVIKNSKIISLNSEDYVLMTFVDISKRKQIEKKNRTFQNDLILLSNCASDLIFLKNTNSILKYVSKGVSEFITNSVVIVSVFNAKENNFTIIDFSQDRKLANQLSIDNYLDKSFELEDEIFLEWFNENFSNITDNTNLLPQILQDIVAEIEVYDQSYMSSFKYDKHIFGMLFIVTNKTKIINKEIIGSFLNQASMSLYKRILEEDLFSEKEQAVGALRNREILLKEVHHRVKNNMAVISSLLKLQAATIQDPELDKAFTESRNRIKSMALVHEKLYAGGDLEYIDFGDYVTTLMKHLLSSYRFMLIKYEITAKDIFIDLDSSISLGLIVNEIVTNSLKYAFTGVKEFEEGEREAIIFAHVTEQDSQIELRIGDNGKGIPKENDIGVTQSLGMELISSLSQQIDATISLNREKGTEYILTFSNKHKNGKS